MDWQGKEKRRFPRAAFPCKIAVGYPLHWLVAHTENISIGGVSVMLEEKLNAFTPVNLDIFLGKDRIIKCQGVVSWVKEKINPVEKNVVLYDVGIKFTVMSEDDMEYVNRLVVAFDDQEKKSDKVEGG
ncbi:MAG: PilZ domain-containing protein [Candidatus Omnitrophota bacterium]|nr:PilZ domain-containing protein [Candidatus Omnitrophota bacterium]